jgi:anion transporter
MNTEMIAVLAVLVVTIILWITKPFGLPVSASALFFVAALIVIGVPPATVFSGFASTSFWTLIPALFFGHALYKTNLGTRIALFCIKSADMTLPRLIFVWGVIGIILSLLTPSMAVRVVIVSPIAVSCADMCGFPKQSKERSIVLISAWLMAVMPGIGWMTGSLNGPILNEMFAVNGLGEISFADWAKVSLLPVLLVAVLTVVIGYRVMRPHARFAIPKKVFAEEYRKLGPATRPEKATGLILVLCFVMFMTHAVHHVPDVVVCLAALVALAALGVIKAEDVSKGISWDLVIFIGVTMAFGTVFEATGVSAWLSGAVADAIAPIAGTPWTLLFVVMPFLCLWRFVDVATFVPTMAIVCAMLSGISERYGISPLIWVPLLGIAQNTFLLSYTNLFALISEKSMGESGWNRRHFSQYGAIYCLVAIASMAVAIPYWQALGMFG